MPVPEWLSEFGNRCAMATGAAVERTENGVSLKLRGRAVQVDVDRSDPERAVLWLELQPPALMQDAALAAAAVRYTTDALVRTRCAMGYNAKAQLLMLGSSLERGALGPGKETGLLDAMLAQAADADAALAGKPEAAGAVGQDSPPGPDPRFKAYVGAALAGAGIEPPELGGNRLSLQVAERWLEVIFEPREARLVFVGIAALGLPVKAELLAQFNAYNLFHGGYSLISPAGDDGLVYLAQPHGLDRLPADQMLQRLADFEERAGAAGTWYLTWTPEPAGAAA